MVAPLNELVRLTGSAFKVSQIPGFGSYQDGSSEADGACPRSTSTPVSGPSATWVGVHVDVESPGSQTAQRQLADETCRRGRPRCPLGGATKLACLNR